MRAGTVKIVAQILAWKRIRPCLQPDIVGIRSTLGSLPGRVQVVDSTGARSVHHKLQGSGAGWSLRNPGWSGHGRPAFRCALRGLLVLFQAQGASAIHPPCCIIRAHEDFSRPLRPETRPVALTIGN